MNRTEHSLNVQRQTSLSAELSVADPYIITKMLYQGLFERLAKAKGAIERGDLESKGKLLGSATAILENLKSTLDFSVNAHLAQNLFDLYSYMLDKVADASVNLNCRAIDNAIKVFLPIKEAWDKIPVSAQQEANRIRARNDSYAHEFENHGSITRVVA